MSLTGIVLDVSGSMKDNIKSGTDEPGGPWAQSIFKVVDDLIEHDVLSDNGVFAIGAGANCGGKEVFDVIATLQIIQNISYLNKKTPATKDKINMIFDILEKNGARNIRKWANDISLIRDIVPDYMAALILWKLASDEQFLTKFVYEFLPSGCRDMIPTASHVNDVENPGLLNFVRRKVANVVEDYVVWAVSIFRPATREEILEIVKKSNCYISLQNVGTNSVFSVKEASRVIRGLNEKELSTERKQELLEKVEPFIYGRSTPLYESLENAMELFERETLRKNKLLFVLSDGLPTDGSNKDTAKINQITSKLRKEGVKIASCFITRSTDIHPKRLYDDILPGFEPGAKFLFSLSSEVPTQHLSRAILVKRGWTMINVANNEMKLFMQVNHPENLREACEMACDVVYSSDALSELLVSSVDLDIYINQTTGPCYVNASAAVLHLAMRRILGREGGYPDFGVLKDEMIKAYGNDSVDMRNVLQEICPKYRLHCRQVFAKGATKAIVEKRLVVAIFFLTDDEWMAFSNFYEDYPMGILTQNELNVRRRCKSLLTFGHAVVLTSYNSKCLTFMNSWGEEWADKRFFRVQNAEVLQLEFFDVYWTLNDLTEGEKEYYHKHGHGSEVAAKLVSSLKGLQKAEYTCPECEQTSLVTEFTGTVSKVRCPKCLREFSTNDNAGNILALNMYLTSLSR